ncbi:MAG: hypothetical protein AABY22_03265 [Nanoarchaeota archaeon]
MKRICTKCLIEKELDEFAKCSKDKFKKTSKCKQCYNEYTKSRRKQINIWRKEHRLKNSIIEKHKRSKYRKQKRQSSPEFRLKCNVSKCVWEALKKQAAKKNSPTWKKLPYSPLALKKHLEKQFEIWMNWDNYGTKWSIDHIIPQSLFPYDSLDHPNFFKCWDLNNLRPLESSLNSSKGNKLI